MKTMFTALLMIACMLTAQTPDPLRWGIKGGLNFAELKGDHFNDSENDYNTGIAIGFFSEKPVNDSFSVQWELLYSMKGVSMNFSETEYDMYSETRISYEANLNLNYFEIPVSFRMKLPTGSGFTPSFYAGGAVAFNIAAKADYKYSIYEYYDDGSDFYEYTQNDSGSEEIDNINELDIGLIFGLGLNIPIKDGLILFDLRYNYGLSTVFDDGESKVYNRVLSFTAGFGL